MSGKINYQSYHLTCLKTFEVIIDFDITRCLRHLARILSYALVLRQLKIDISLR